MKDTREELIRQVKLCGASLIQNAESIVGSEEFLCDLCIRIDLEINNGIPTINIDKTFTPEGLNTTS